MSRSRNTILHIITGLNNGGAEAVLYRLTTADQENTHQVISMMDSGIYGKRLEAAGICVHTLDMLRGHVTCKGLFKLYRLIRVTNPDVIQTWMYHADLIGGVVARLAGKHAVVWGIRHSNLAPGINSRSTCFVAQLCAWLSPWVPRKIISCSVEAARIHTELGYQHNKLIVVANGYDLARLTPDANARRRVRAELEVEPDTVLLGMVARWDPQKDHANLIAALAQFGQQQNHDWLCVLVGPDMTDANPALVSLLVQYGVRARVKLLGPRHDVPAIMNALDVHVLSSAGEAFPNVVVEAMACGTPCVITDVGDAAMIVGETGWVVSPGEPALLAAALNNASAEIGDTKGWCARKLACRGRVVEKFGIDRMVKAYQSVWQDVISFNDAVDVSYSIPRMAVISRIVASAALKTVRALRRYVK